MHKDIDKILVTEEQISQRSFELGKQISKDYQGKAPLFVALLKGSIPFMAQLIKNCEIDNMQIDFMAVSSYAGTESTQSVKIIKDLDRDISNADIIIVEDIVDTGFTLEKVIKLMYDKGAKSVKVVSLLNKAERREIDLEADYIGFEIPNEFVVGYGLDYNEKYRQLPYIGILKSDVYQ